MKRVFLGGTCQESTWRQQLIPMLKIDYFDPVVDDWDEEAQQKELYEREYCDYCLYLITPKMEGFYSIAEVVDDSNKRPDKTILCILAYDTKGEKGMNFTSKQEKSLSAIARMIERNGAKFFNNLNDVANYLNND